MKKIITMGLLGGLIMLVIGMASSQIFLFLVPSIKVEYQNQFLFRAWSDPLMMLFFIHPFLLGLVLAWLWSKIKELVEGETDLMKGLNFGLVIWLVATLPGMLMTYSSFAVSLSMVLNWTYNSFLELIIVGVFFAKTLK